MLQDRRSELLGQAEVLIRTRGYSGFSYADLATVADIRKSSIHHHFPSKEDLGVALVDAYDARYDEAMAAILARSQNGLKRVEAYAALYLHGVEAGQGCLCAALATELGILPARLREQVAAFFAKHVAWLELVLRDGRANDSIAGDVSPAQHARMIVATLEGALMMERLLGGTKGFTTTLTALRKTLRA